MSAVWKWLKRWWALFGAIFLCVAIAKAASGDDR